MRHPCSLTLPQLRSCIRNYAFTADIHPVDALTASREVMHALTENEWSTLEALRSAYVAGCRLELVDVWAGWDAGSLAVDRLVSGRETA